MTRKLLDIKRLLIAVTMCVAVALGAMAQADLHDHGYNGYVSTEYEGNRWVLPDHEIPEVQQVTAHQKMIQRYIKEIEG